MKFIVTGGTGLVGKRVVRKLIDAGHSVVVPSRSTEKVQKIFGNVIVLTRSYAEEAKQSSSHKTTGPQIFTLNWFAENEEFAFEYLDGVDGVINLMGENLADGRWTNQQKMKIRRSRVDGTQHLARAFVKAGHECKVWVQASAIGFYAANTDIDLDETHKQGTGMLSELCKDWEEAAPKEFDLSATEKLLKRFVIARSGVVFGKDGGAIKKLYPIFNLGLGGPIGNGAQFMSWIHVEDLSNLFVEMALQSKYVGAYNAVSPKPASNNQFTKAFAGALGRPAFFPVPPIALKLAFGEMSSVILDSQKVYPERLKEVSFQWRYGDLQAAMNEIAGK